ncbi:hypothetical protein C7S16_5010 [Burkholderia thailandensis]|uniref:Uncharacterized protein n=1 Tax=Burkholderia thailandensis TaxID=57975 RepID=A0AAW9CRA2_BURTH|nr:hypothetical protein [Burkholderia thailandensis]MDW9253555.1 hypothetical protein [Burkholderia thailandensis]
MPAASIERAGNRGSFAVRSRFLRDWSKAPEFGCRACLIQIVIAPECIVSIH